jgi:hypothetical protein
MNDDRIRYVRPETLTLHKEAGRVPEMPAEQWRTFLQSVRAHGVREPLRLLPGTSTVLDGRHRLKAAKVAGLPEVPVVDAPVGPDESPLLYLLECALAHRHLTQSQRAMLAVEVEQEEARAARERQKAGGQKGGETAGRGRPKVADRGQANLPEPLPGPQARDAAGKKAGVSGRAVGAAKALANRSPELAAKVRNGEMTLNQATLRQRQREKREEMELKAEAARGTFPAAAPWSVVTGDCRGELRKMAEKSNRVGFLDPLYNFGVRYGPGVDDARSPAAYYDLIRSVLKEVIPTLTDDGSLWLLCPHEHAATFEMMLTGRRVVDEDAGLDLRGLYPLTVRNWITVYEPFGVNCTNKFNRCSRRLLHCVVDPDRFVFHADAVRRPSDRQVFYHDRRACPDGKVLDDVWHIDRVAGSHDEKCPGVPNQVPLQLLRWVIGCASDLGDTIVDPMAGSGSTGVVCREMGRGFVGVEIDAETAALARTRIAATVPNPPPAAKPDPGHNGPERPLSSRDRDDHRGQRAGGRTGR